MFPTNLAMTRIAAPVFLVLVLQGACAEPEKYESAPSRDSGVAPASNRDASGSAYGPETPIVDAVSGIDQPAGGRWSAVGRFRGNAEGT